MVCKNCNAENPDNGMFCTSCGQKLVKEPAEVPATEFCSFCGSPLEPGSKFCRECGTYMTDTPPSRYKEKPVKKKTTEKKRNSRKIGLIAAICGAALLTLIVAAGFVIGWLNLSGPGVQIAAAAGRTLSAENVTVSFEFANDYGFGTQKAKGEMQVSFVPNKRQLNLYGNMKTAGEISEFAVYNGYLIVKSAAGNYRVDIREDLEGFFDDYEEAMKEDRDLENILADLDEHIHFDALEDCLEEYGKKLNNKQWLEENAGYSVEKENGTKVHTFGPDLYTFLKESLPFFEEAFKNKNDYKEAKDMLDNSKTELRAVDVVAQMGVKGGKMVSLALEVADEEGVGFLLDAKFSNIGSTEMDWDKLEKLLGESKDMPSGLGTSNGPVFFG